MISHLPRLSKLACALIALSSLYVSLLLSRSTSLFLSEGEFSRTSPLSEQCETSLLIWRLDELEQLFPELVGCHITTYGGQLYEHILALPCQVRDVSKADFLVLPPYMAEECNWPHYGHADCHHPENTWRAGANWPDGTSRGCCREEAIPVARTLIERYKKPVVLVVSHPSIWRPRDTHILWFGVNQLRSPWPFPLDALDSHHLYRLGTDVSIPLPCWPMCANFASQPHSGLLQNRSIFMLFVGNLNSHPLRRTLAQMFNNNRTNIIVGRRDDFEELMTRALFCLIIRGDREMSYRFGECVCAGGVPVLITNKWVPPFSELAAFESYGVEIEEQHVNKLEDILRSYDWLQLEAKRERAAQVCKEYFVDAGAHARQMAKSLTGLKPGHWFYTQEGVKAVIACIVAITISIIIAGTHCAIAISWRRRQQL